MHTLSSSSSSAHSRNRGDRQAGWDMHANRSAVLWIMQKGNCQAREENAHGREVNCHDQLTCTSPQNNKLYGLENRPDRGGMLPRCDKELARSFRFIQLSTRCRWSTVERLFSLFSFRKSRNEMRFFFWPVIDACTWRLSVKSEANIQHVMMDLTCATQKTYNNFARLDFFLFVVANRSSLPAIVDRSPMKTLFRFFLLFFLSLPPKKITVSISEKLTRARAHLN